ncbi:MAG: cytochrome-c peroxidase [Bacteroidetes bacterium]|nr:MAG: cytochrome-c peroxidase [Bacteroidota bacterium]
MHIKTKYYIVIIGVLGVFLAGCQKDPQYSIPVASVTNADSSYNPTPYTVDIPEGFPDMQIPEDNPMTVEGIRLGKKLFYDPILSGDSTQSCASCHQPSFAFSDPKQFSVGITGAQGTRNAPAIINQGWNFEFFWDGRAQSLEEQALAPVPNPIEMHLQWKDAIVRLKNHPEYPELFYQAFGTKEIDSMHVVKAIAQFERTLISSNSKYHKFLRDEVALTPQELNGMTIYFTEKGDCFHCHGTVLLTDNLYHNNGLDSVFTDLGRYNVTQDPNDKGKFKTPTLINIELTAPYMHDGRFATLEEVIDHYSEGVKVSATIDPLMKKAHQGGLHLTAQEKADLIAFLKTFTDESFINNPDYLAP